MLVISELFLCQKKVTTNIFHYFGTTKKLPLFSSIKDFACPLGQNRPFFLGEDLRMQKIRKSKKLSKTHTGKKKNTNEKNTCKT